MTSRRHLGAARRLAVLFIAALAALDCTRGDDSVANPHPTPLTRPKAAPLSAMAQLGRTIFFDSTLSASGTRSCATCHRPENAYASPARSPIVSVATRAGGGIVRAVPSLRYAYRAPDFSIGPELSDLDGAAPSTTPQVTGTRPTKVAGGASRADVMVARGGLFWDGRVNTLQDQAMGPLLNTSEMGNTSISTVAAKLRHATYARQFVTLFGVDIFAQPTRLVDEAMFAVARFQIEDPSFHPYTSKYDYYLEGKARLTRSEWRGLQAFNDAERGNCAACHLERPRGDGLPPVFTDYEYEALGVPRNTVSAGTDLGACGPLRTDLRDQPQFCGMFRTPSLRNTATRSEFFHNGVYHSLDEVLAFYTFRDVHPERIYPALAGGGVAKFNDLPARYHVNVDTSDAPFNRKPGQAAPMTDAERRDVIAFLRTLTDDYKLSPPGASRPD
jgi:cytochrome c peroxidase